MEFHARRQSAAERLDPSWRSSRYYHLKALRIAVERAIETHVANRGFNRLVDWGCGTMPYRPLFEEHVEEYLGVDMPGNPAAHYAIDGNLVCGLPDETADVVLSSQVLEHVEEPLHYLEEARRLLKNDGLLILSTHGYWMYHPDPTDFWRWTGQGLSRVIEQAGFEILEKRGVMGLASVGAQLLQDGLIGKLPRLLRPIAVVCFQPFVALLDLWHGQNERDTDACVFVVVARKCG